MAVHHRGDPRNGRFVSIAPKPLCHTAFELVRNFRLVIITKFSRRKQHVVLVPDSCRRGGLLLNIRQFTHGRKSMSL